MSSTESSNMSVKEVPFIPGDPLLYVSSRPYKNLKTTGDSL